MLKVSDLLLQKSTSLNAGLPPIIRKVNVRAKRLSLRVKQDGIYLTLPPYAPERTVQLFLESSQDWLVSTWNKAQQQPRQVAKAPLNNGEMIHFIWLHQQWKIVFSEQPRLKQITTLHELHVGETNAPLLIKKWVLMQAQQYLPERLAQLAVQHQLNYRSCTIRHAKTRWGSCSSQASINLNAALMFLPVELVDYVLLHELCHTRQMNHSLKFWQEVQRVDPGFKLHRQQLKQFKLPDWWQ